MEEQHGRDRACSQVPQRDFCARLLSVCLAMDWTPSWNVCPTAQILVLVVEHRCGLLGLMRWGWNPSSIKGRLLINARAEGAHGKLNFREPLERRRCLIPATAFYEWRPGSAG